MEVRLRYYEILEEDLVMELEWLKEEFEVLFDSKIEKLSEMDKKIATDLLIYILENTDVHDNFILLDILEEATDIIEKSYPTLFS
ncbi:unnamed protein product [marine sediment metagenome]|uniref:Uncharacterized protein n=1 Tax=marine sediment metagenome TaxID=412755 RepID=X0Z315_9ZZZZ